MNKKLTILAVGAVVAALTSLGSVATAHDPCDVTVTSTISPSIQSAVDTVTDLNVDGLRVVCLDDGVFPQQVVFTAANSGVALRPMVLQAAPDASPVLDGTTLQGTGPTTIDAIRLTDGVNGLTIRGLEIREYKGDGGDNDRSSAISAFGPFQTSNVTIRDNYMHDFTWNAVLVGSEGDFIHDDWTVKDNIVTNAGFVGIEFTNVASRSSGTSHIEGNTVTDSGVVGILVQARNTLGNTVSPVVRDIEVEENEVSGTGRPDTSIARPGIWLLSLESVDTGDPFDPSDGTARITDVEVEENNVTDNFNDGIRLQGFNAATIDDIEVEENTVTVNGRDGMRLDNADDSEIEENTATGNTGNGIALINSDNNEIEENTATGNGDGTDTFDILQDADSTGNEFEDNTCNTKSDAGSGPIDCGA